MSHCSGILILKPVRRRRQSVLQAARAWSEEPVQSSQYDAQTKEIQP